MGFVASNPSHERGTRETQHLTQQTNKQSAGHKVCACLRVHADTRSPTDPGKCRGLAGSSCFDMATPSACQTPSHMDVSEKMPSPITHATGVLGGWHFSSASSPITNIVFPDCCGPCKPTMQPVSTASSKSASSTSATDL
jgi:hypothetical protein